MTRDVEALSVTRVIYNMGRPLFHNRFPDLTSLLTLESKLLRLLLAFLFDPKESYVTVTNQHPLVLGVL